MSRACRCSCRARIDQDPRYKGIVKHNRPVQTRLARELHDQAGVAIGRCGIYEVKQFQAYLPNILYYQVYYQINGVSKELHNSLIYIGSDKKEENLPLPS